MGHRDAIDDATVATSDAAHSDGTGDASRLHPGDLVGRYVVRRQIGAGAMGAVYEAFDPDLDRKLAIKVVRADTLAGSSADARRARLVREAQAQARLTHPNVVTVHDVGTVDGQVFVAVELIDGVTLRAWSTPTRPWRQVVSIYCKAGRGLAAAHAARLIHRDFKPDNVLVGRTGRVCVTDFGLARAIDALDAPAASAGDEPAGALSTDLTRTGAILGTPRYMSPEQHACEPTDPRTDQFSFCVALYEALYGETPYAGSTLTELATAIQRQQLREPPPGSRVPGWLRKAVLRGLALRPEDRYPSMDALMQALRAGRGRWLSLVLVAVAATAVLVGGGVARSGCAQGAGELGPDASATAVAPQASVAVADAIPAAIAHWSFDRDTIRDGRVLDQIGEAHGDLVGGAAVVGVRGEAIDLDGEDDCIRVRRPPKLGDRFSIAAWVRLRTEPQGPDNPGIYDRWDWPGDLRSYALGTNTGRFAARVSMDGEWQTMREASTAAPIGAAGLNRWTHVAMTYDKKTVRLYLDGELAGADAFVFETIPFEPEPDYPILLGCSHDDGRQPGSFLNGMLDEMFVWDRALTPAEVRAVQRRH